MRRSVLVVVAALLLAVPLGRAWFPRDAAGAIVLQQGGRLKPLSAFAQETLRFISGRTSWQGQDAAVFFIDGLDDPRRWLELSLVRVEHPGLKKALGLEPGVRHVSYNRLSPVLAQLQTLAGAAEHKQARGEALLAFDRQAQRLWQQVMAVKILSSGAWARVIPPPHGDTWLSPEEENGEAAADVLALAQAHASRSPDTSARLRAWTARVAPALGAGMMARVAMEAFYYALAPFFLAGLFYLAGAALLIRRRETWAQIGGMLLAVGFVYHTLGLLLRTLVLLRPPVANMYETMIFMDWVLMICVGALVLVRRQRFLLSSGALVSAMVMLYAALLPVDRSLDVLAPVLRSSYWLTVHVITIISSYSLFAFAMAVSHRHIFLQRCGRLPAPEARASALAIERLLQWGLIALGAGTVLGGVWANEAWGRFWGWDPKETWAFITFLGYLIVLHLRHARRIGDFGLAVGGILGFLLVVMTWYGVNFVLGRGMHSYGAGSGGLGWVLLFVGFEAVFLAAAMWSKSSTRGRTYG